MCISSMVVLKAKQIQMLLRNLGEFFIKYSQPNYLDITSRFTISLTDSSTIVQGERYTFSKNSPWAPPTHTTQNEGNIFFDTFGK